MDLEWPEISSFSASIICLLLAMLSVWFLVAFIAFSALGLIFERDRRLGSILVLCVATLVATAGCGHMSAINTEREARNALASATQHEADIMGDGGPRALARTARAGNRLARESLRDGDIDGTESILDQQADVLDEMVQRSSGWEQGAQTVTDATGQTIQSAQNTVDETDLLQKIGLGGDGLMAGGIGGLLLGGGAMAAFRGRGRRKQRRDPLYLRPRRGRTQDDDDPRMTQEQYDESHTTHARR